MATFAEYPAQTMAPNDFTLYPYPESWSQDQTYLPTSSYQDASYLSATTFDSYPAQQSFAPLPDHFDFPHHTIDPSKDHLQAPSRHHSPAHSYDYPNPPALSTVSDSGASVQSTISSAMGSPSSQHQANEWNQHQNAHLFPGIVAQADGIFTTSFDFDTIPVTDKGCVGELTTISSSQQPQIASHFNTSPFSFPSDFAMDDWSPLPTPQSPLATQPSRSVSAEDTSPCDNPVFRSPSTPASATSPVLERVRGARKSSAALATSKKLRASSPLTKSMSYDESEVPPRPAAPRPALQSPFFSQSSGYFVPPLESSYPSLIQPFSPTQYTGTQFADMQPQNLPYPSISSPVPAKHLSHSPREQSVKPQGSASPYPRPQSWQPYPQYQGSRRQSISSVHSRHSQNSLSSDDSNKGLCPIATCGRHVKDLKAHMLTHQNERPEKCPIPTCEYHTKGFARKYDKNRHTLTHYKGTMVCGFCPGNGTTAEKSFNRADVFKRHLTSVHGVEQTPPNARRKSPSSASKKPFGSAREVSGMCSTCGNTFASAQDFYEHLDDCVLRVVQQAEPSEAINEKILTAISKDEKVQETMEKHMLPTSVDYNAPTSFDDEDEVDEDEEVDEDDANDGTYGSRKSGRGAMKATKASGSRISNNGAITKPTKKGLTYSKNGVPLSGGMTGKGSKRRKNYPLSWGAAPDKMRMKKRVLCVYDGQRRLWKDDMMLDADHEVRIPLPGEDRAWVTDLDVATLQRAEGLHNATEEEKGPWQGEDIESLMS